jgi:membrane protein DedA with SNARE-associated domain
MEHLLSTLLLGTNGAVAYAVVFAVLVLCGLGLPLPEDVTLILSGYLAYSKAVRADVMLVVCFAGILAGDSSIFFIGRRLGRNIKPGSWVSKLVTQEKLLKVEGLFAKWGQKLVMAARFMPGVRAGVYFAAGASGLSYWRFLLFDGIAASISVPVWVLVAKHFGGNITHFINIARNAQFTVLGVLFGLVVGWVLLQRTRQRRAEREAATARAAEVALTPGEPLSAVPPASEPAPAERVTH